MISTGVIVTKQLLPTKHVQSYIVPDNVSNLLIKNKGQHDVELCFDAGRSDNAYTIDRGEILPTLGVKAGTTVIKYSSQTGKGLLNLILWG